MRLSIKHSFAIFNFIILLLALIPKELSAQEIDCDMETNRQDYHYCSTYLGHVMDFTNGFIRFRRPQDYGYDFCSKNQISGYYMLKPDTDEDCLTYLKNHLNDCPMGYMCFDWEYPGNGYFGTIQDKINAASCDASPNQYCVNAPTFQCPVNVAEDNESNYMNLDLINDNSSDFVETLDNAWVDWDLSNSIYFRAVQIIGSPGLNDAAMITFIGSQITDGEGQPEPSPNPSSIFEWDLIINTTNGGHELYDVYDPPTSADKVRFQRTLTHELCHVIGLGHVQDPFSGDNQVPLMVKPAQTTAVSDATVANSACVKRGIQCLYGCSGTGIGCIDSKTCNKKPTTAEFKADISIDSESKKTLSWVVQDENVFSNTFGFNVYKKSITNDFFESVNDDLIKLEQGKVEYSLTIDEFNNNGADADSEYYLELVSYPSDRMVLLYSKEKESIEFNSMTKPSEFKEGQ